MTSGARRRGRPPFKPTAKQRREVEEFVSCGMKAVQIARAIGIHEDTLQKHFAEELATGQAKRRGEVIRLLYRSARAGNVSAQKKLEEMTQRAAAEAAFVEPEPKQPKKGKKEAATEAALMAGQGSDWGDDLTFPHKPN